MNCIEFRRLLLTEPRALSQEQQAHSAQCDACASFAKEIGDQESQITEAVLVPVPESLDERVLLRQRIRRPARLALFALAASMMLAAGIGFFAYQERKSSDDHVIAGSNLDSQHPAVAAISYVLDHEPQLLLANQRGDPVVMRDALLRLGIKLPEDKMRVRYLGKCPVPGGAGEHLVLNTPHGHVTLILVPDRSLGSRRVVDYRNRVAVASPLSSGSYILVGESLHTLRRLEQMLM
ncbi:MAG: DUF3379 family protein [Betaproteobacteria bacterium]